MSETRKCQWNGYTCTNYDGSACCSGRVPETRSCVPCDETGYKAPSGSVYTKAGNCAGNVFIFLTHFRSHFPFYYLQKFRTNAILRYSFLAKTYKKCFTSALKTCSQQFRTGDRQGGYDWEVGKCINHCEEDPHCKFVFHVIRTTGKHAGIKACYKYRSCDSTRKPLHIGTTYSKQGTCPGFWVFIIYIDSRDIIFLLIPYCILLYALYINC